MANKVFGTIKQNEKISLRVQTVQWAGSERYDIRAYNGDYAIKGVTLSKDEIIKLRDILEEFFAGDPEEIEFVDVAEEVQPEPEQKTEIKLVSTSWADKTEDEKIIHSLTSIPVNDGNYPLNTATVEQLRKAVEYMEAHPDGQKTRLARCKGRLSKLEKADTKVLLAKTAVQKSDKVVAIKPAKEKQEAEPEVQAKETKAPVIKFPKKDTTQITKLPPSEVHYTYDDAKEKLDKERRLFKGDRDSEYVIDGILEACVSDQEFLDNVMRPEKSYVGAFQYFARKAREGYCMMVGNVGVMDADTALKYAIDYFNSEDPKPKKTVKPDKKEGGKNDKKAKGRTDEEVHEECAAAD